jgi:hypothetical protein
MSIESSLILFDTAFFLKLTMYLSTRSRCALDNDLIVPKSFGCTKSYTVNQQSDDSNDPPEP